MAPKEIQVAYGIDVDAVAGWLGSYGGEDSPDDISRGLFAGEVGTPRLLKLFDKYRLKTTWFTPGHTIETYPDCARAVFKAGHEIAHHGWTHTVPATLSREEEEAELVRGNAAITALTGKNARGYRSPSWDITPHTVALLLKHGFLYDSSLMGHDYLPYQAREADTIELQKPAVRGKATKLVEMPISWTLDDFPVFEYMRNPNGVQAGLMNASAVLENWVDDFVYLRDNLEWGILTYTFHPHVIGRGHRMIMLEKLVRQLVELGAQFRTMEEAVGAYQERCRTR